MTVVWDNTLKKVHIFLHVVGLNIIYVSVLLIQSSTTRHEPVTEIFSLRIFE